LSSARGEGPSVAREFGARFAGIAGPGPARESPFERPDPGSFARLPGAGAAGARRQFDAGGVSGRLGRAAPAGPEPAALAVWGAGAQRFERSADRGGVSGRAAPVRMEALGARWSAAL